MKFFVLLLSLLLAIPAAAQKRNQPNVPVLPVITEGITYSLPRTGIRVMVKARQTTYVPGPYAMFADQLLGIRDVKAQAHTQWVIEDVSIDTYAEPDPAQVYKATGGAAFLQLTPSGILAGINLSNAPETEDKVFSNSFATPDKAAGLTYHNLIDNPSLSGRTPADQRAVQAANRILKARSVRFDIVSGMLDEFHPDGEAYEESLGELSRTEEELLSLFVGKTSTGKYTYAFEYVPTGPVTGEVICRFDEMRGFLPKSDLSGKPVMIDVVREEALAARMAAVKGEQATDAGFTGLYYRQPGMARISVSRELTVIATGKATVAQFGEIAPVPAGLLDGNHSIEFHPGTGAIKSVSKK